MQASNFCSFIVFVGFFPADVNLLCTIFFSWCKSILVPIIPLPQAIAGGKAFNARLLNVAEMCLAVQSFVFERLIEFSAFVNNDRCVGSAYSRLCW